MVDKLRLEYELKKKGIKVAWLCDRIGISRAAYYRKLNGTSAIALEEAAAIAKEAQLGKEEFVDIFLARFNIW